MKVDNKHILCLTSSYPYGKNEAYFENELQYLAEKYTVVYIQPLYRPSLTDALRTLPANVKVLDPLLSNGKLSRIKAGIFNTSPVSLYVSDFFNNKVYSAKGKLLNWFNSLLVYRIAYKKLTKLISEFDDSLVFYAYWASCALVFSSPKLLKFKKIIRLHGGDVYLDRNDGYLPIRQKIYDAADVLVPISVDIANLLKGHYKIPETKILVNRLGVNNVIEKCSVEGDAIVIVTCSNLYPLKRVHLIAQALEQITCTKKIIWHHFGDGPEYNKVEAITRHFPENVTVVFHGWVSQKELYEFYTENYVTWFINVSTHEGIPVSIMEAFSFGIPAIATNVGGTSEIVNASNGFLVEREVDVATLGKMITNPDGNYYMKRKIAYDTWLQSYNAKVNFEEFINRIQS